MELGYPTPKCSLMISRATHLLRAGRSLTIRQAHPGEPGAFDIVEEPGGNQVLRMHYTGSELQPPGTPLTPLVALWNDSFVNPVYSDGYLRAQVKVDEPNAVGCLGQGDLASGNGYTLCMVALDEGIDHEKAGHQFHIDRFVNGAASLKWLSGRDDNIEFEFADWWNMELGVVGATISARVWEVGTSEPPEPQFVWTDPSRVPGGQIGLYSLVQSELMPVPSRADASFDNVAFTIPEPTTLLLLAGVIIVGAVPSNRQIVPRRHKKFRKANEGERS